jgi:signal transduction histidine kinase
MTDIKGELLVVDDATVTLRQLTRTLETAGFQVCPVDSGELALASVAAKPPDLILLDINMPGMDGFEVCRRLKADPRTVDIPIIFLSAENEVAKQIEGFQCGAIDFVTKPFEAGILLMRVKTRLELNRLRRQTKERLAELERTQTLLHSEMNARNELQAQLFQQEKMASIGQLAAGVAHEINNPMGFVISNLGTLEKYIARFDEYLGILDRTCGEALSQVSAERSRLKIDYLIQDTHLLLEECLGGAIRVKEIVQNLKSFSRIDQPGCHQTDINQCLESAITIAWNEIKYMAEIVKELSKLPPVTCNPQQINQVFLNLLKNAAQSIELPGAITLRSWCSADSVYVSVTDTGRGIPQENRSRIFEPFFTTKEVGKGTGLGLSISYDIIAKHGGEITVQSQVGIGSTFTVRLPVHETQGGAS